MKFAKIVFVIVLWALPVSAQFSVHGSLGLNFTTVPEIVDYINANFASPGEKLGSVQSAPEFSIEAGYRFGDNEVAVECAYELNSYNYSVFLNPYKFEYGEFMPSVIYYKVIAGEGYRFRFGAGVGYRYFTADETLPVTTVATTYTSSGYGVLLRASANTALGSNAYAFIGADIRFNKLGAPENNGRKITSVVSPDPVEPNSLSAGIKLGIAYEF